MSIKVHFVHNHLDQFPANCGNVSDEQGERFHQDIKEMETRYRGRWDSRMEADYCWSTKCDNPDANHSRQSRKRKFLPKHSSSFMEQNPDICENCYLKQTKTYIVSFLCFYSFHVLKKEKTVSLVYLELFLCINI